ncbi:hypothetical protein, partial [Sinorhizobium fredii]|uniref:hypothetical protein n=1 Tax=Rhizobium fredii TaxID=380 RepID=UPI001AEC0CAD
MYVRIAAILIGASKPFDFPFSPKARQEPPREKRLGERLRCTLDTRRSALSAGLADFNFFTRCCTAAATGPIAGVFRRTLLRCQYPGQLLLCRVAFLANRVEIASERLCLLAFQCELFASPLCRSLGYLAGQQDGGFLRRSQVGIRLEDSGRGGHGGIAPVLHRRFALP